MPQQMTKAERSRALRYKRPALATMGWETIREELDNIQEACSDVHWYFDTDEDTLTIRPAGDDSTQTSFDGVMEDQTGISKNASLKLYFRDTGDDKPWYDTVDNFSIGNALLGKLSNLFTNLHKQYMRFFFEEVMKNGLLAPERLPDIEDSDADIPEDLPEDE